ncbi:MAG: hypothetical protein QOG19_715, partial [Mycobacterium sp.]|nr:hypothetical protein [Mycobacterium sp.]
MTDDGVVAHRAEAPGSPPGLASSAQSPGGRPNRTSLAESFAGADSEADAERRTALRRMKVVALSFLVGATVVFLACRWANAHGAAPSWV